MAKTNQRTKVNKVSTPSPTKESPRPKAAAPAFKIQSAKERKRFGNFLFYGNYGVGKSTLAATASEVPDMSKVLYINAEGGDESLKGFDIDLIDISSFSQFARVHEYLRLHCSLRDRFVNNGDEEAKDKLLHYESLLKGTAGEEPTLYYTVVIDSLTEVQKYCMYQLLGIRVGQHALDVTPDTPQFREWGSSAEMIRLLVRTFRDLPMHTIVVCGQAQEQDDKKRYHYSPLLPGKLSSEVQGFFDVVGYLIAAPTEGGGMHRRLWLEPGETFDAKNRFREFEGRYLDNPSMADLANLSIKSNK